jgi:hypothetical protein
MLGHTRCVERVGAHEQVSLAGGSIGVARALLAYSHRRREGVHVAAIALKSELLLKHLLQQNRARRAIDGQWRRVFAG